MYVEAAHLRWHPVSSAFSVADESFSITLKSLSGHQQGDKEKPFLVAKLRNVNYE